MRKKIIPIGIENFEEMITENYYYVYKTMFIDEILRNRTKVTLFTRPRRFGKTLNMSMLKYFFNIENREENRKLFENLKVHNSEYMSEQGEYPVIFFSLKDIRANSWEKCFIEMKKLMSKIYNEFEFFERKFECR